MNNTYLSTIPNDILTNILVYLDNEYLKFLSRIIIDKKNLDEVCKLLIQISFGNNMLLDIITCQFDYSWIKIYITIKEYYSFINNIEYLKYKDVETIFDIKSWYRDIDLKYVMFYDRIYKCEKKSRYKRQIIFKMAFMKVFPKQFSLLKESEYFRVINWETLYPNVIAISEKIHSLNDSTWNKLINNYKEYKGKWENYPEMIYLFEKELIK